MKEKEIEDKLEKNLNKIEKGLVLIERQKRVQTGIIDLFCNDTHGNYVIVEIKKKPDAKVVAQLAKYNMALVKIGINRKRIRTILVAQEIPHAIKEACDFLNFETKTVYKEKSVIIEDPLIGIPNQEELLNFITSQKLVNISMVARFFDIYHTTAKELVYDMQKNNLVTVRKLGGSNIVTLK